MEKELKKLEGKTIKIIEFPDNYVSASGGSYSDDNMKITFTDGTELELASWDYEGYSSGIYKKINGKEFE